MLCLLHLTFVLLTSLFCCCCWSFKTIPGNSDKIFFFFFFLQLWDFLGWHLLTYKNLGLFPLKILLFSSPGWKKSPSVKKCQADKRIILSQGQYVNTLTSRTCLEELHFPLPNYILESSSTTTFIWILNILKADLRGLEIWFPFLALCDPRPDPEQILGSVSGSSLSFNISADLRFQCSVIVGFI